MSQSEFFLLHRWGKSETSKDPGTIYLLLKELDAAEDDEHVSVSVREESGWSVTAYVSGLVVFENVEDLAEQPQHLSGQTRDQARMLMEFLATGELVLLRQQAWRAGYGPAPIQDPTQE